MGEGGERSAVVERGEKERKGEVPRAGDDATAG